MTCHRWSRMRRVVLHSEDHVPDSRQTIWLLPARGNRPRPCCDVTQNHIGRTPCVDKPTLHLGSSHRYTTARQTPASLRRESSRPELLGVWAPAAGTPV